MNEHEIRTSFKTLEEAKKAHPEADEIEYDPDNYKIVVKYLFETDYDSF